MVKNNKYLRGLQYHVFFIHSWFLTFYAVSLRLVLKCFTNNKKNFRAMSMICVLEHNMVFLRQCISFTSNH